MLFRPLELGPPLLLSISDSASPGRGDVASLRSLRIVARCGLERLDRSIQPTAFCLQFPHHFRYVQGSLLRQLGPAIIAAKAPAVTFQLPTGVELISSVENEYLCLRILTALGLPGAKAEMQTLGDRPVLRVERFDRLSTEDQRLLCLPQEDSCPALSVVTFGRSGWALRSVGDGFMWRVLALLFSTSLCSGLMPSSHSPRNPRW